MPKTPDSSEQLFEFRHGLTRGPARGIVRQKTPSKLSPDEFWTLQNARIVGNQLVSRGGLNKVNTGGALSGTILSIFDDLNG